MPETLAYSTTLTVLSCGSCEIPFAMPRNLHKAALADGRWFWCPNGHKIHYASTENDQLREKLAQAERSRDAARTARDAARDQADAAERSARAYRGHATRLRNRAAAGVCPVPSCRRHFANLQRHMDGQHPDFADQEQPDA